MSVTSLGGGEKPGTRFGGRVRWIALGVGVAVVCGGLVVRERISKGGAQAAKEHKPAPIPAVAKPNAASNGSLQLVSLTDDQQRAIGLKVEPVTVAGSYERISAPGQVIPDENQYAYITPRAPGVVRSVSVRIGQDVKKGDLLATVDSPEVAQARIDLVTKLQEREVARTQADWQAVIYKATIELLDRVKRGDEPDAIHREFEGRIVGENRERLLTAYSNYRLAKINRARYEELHKTDTVTLKAYQQAVAEDESARAAFQGLVDRVGYEATLADTRASQAKRQAETAVRVARARLRVIGIEPDDVEKWFAEWAPEPQSRQPASPEKAAAPASPSAPNAASALAEAAGVNTYEIRALFDGTILDRELLVPGVAVDVTHRIITMANLSTVWVEAHVHESQFARLAQSRGGKIVLRSPAYPGREFEGTVLYSGDLVDEKSRTVKLLARAENKDRALKPGLFVDVEILSPERKELPSVPETALLTDGDDAFVYVATADGAFERREVEVGPRDDGRAAILKGLKPGENVVTEGGFKLKSEAIRNAS